MKVFTRALAILGLVLPSGVVIAAPPAEVKLDIRKQPIRTALAAFSNQSGIQIVYPDDEVTPELISPTLVGKYAPQVALDRLLADTGLCYQYVNDRTVAIRRAASPESKKNSEETERPLVLAQSGEEDIAASQRSESRGAERSSTRIEEVVVTASKREERLIDTPQSVTVLSSEMLSKMGATQFRDFANTVPGLTFTTTGAGSNQISLRGVTTGVENNPTVGVYLDDVPVGSSTAFAFGARLAFDAGLFDIDRLEVLRGPQGTLYGASTMGGLLKYVSRRPDPANFGIDAQTGASSTASGDFNYLGSATVNVPLGERTALRASGFYSRDGGYVDNVAFGAQDADRSKIYGGRINFLTVVSDALEIQFGAFLQTISRDGQSTADYSFSGIPRFGDLAQSRPVAEPFDQRLLLMSGKVTYGFGSASLTSISAYQTMERETIFDVSALFVPLVQSFFDRTYASIGLPDRTTTHKFTQELRFASEGENAVDWLIGGFYTHEASRVAEEFSLRDVNGQPLTNDLYTFNNPTQYEESAAFGDLTHHFSSRFDVSVGARYAKNRQVFRQEGAGILGSSTPTLYSSEGVLTYLANTRYHLSERATAYLRYATGYRPGGANFTGFDPEAPATFKADRLKSYEAGYKRESFDGRFGIDFAGYYIHWRDIQLSRALGGFDNAGKAEIRGVELAFTARPVPAFTLSTAIALQDAQLSEAAPNLGGRDGERLPNVPRFTGALNADYELMQTGLRPTVGATVRYVSRRNASFDGSTNFPQYELPAYASVDLRTSATFDMVNVQLYAHNLLNRRGQLSSFNGYSTFGGPAQVSILQPRSIGVTVTMRF